MPTPVKAIWLPADITNLIDQEVDGQIVQNRTHAIRVAIALWLQSRKEAK